MAKNPKVPSGSDQGPGGRADVKYVALPKALWKRLKDFADRDERSVSWAARKAVQEFLDRQEAG